MDEMGTVDGLAHLPYLWLMDHRVIIMHNFELADIDRIMRAVRRELDRPTDLIFAKTTENSLQMKVGALIEDLTEDHEYLKNNPPPELNRKPD